MPLDNLDKHRIRRIDKAKEEKEIIGLWMKNMKLLRTKRGNRELVELDKPVRKGYKRFFVLRADIARGTEASFYRKFLPEIQVKQYCNDKEFLQREYPSRKLKPMGHNPKQIEHKRWNELNYSAKEKAMFDELWIPNRDHRGRMAKGGRFVYAFKKPWMFVSKIEPHYITHRFVINPQLESELQELHNKIDRNNLGPKAAKAMGWSYGWRDWKHMRTKIFEEIIDKEKQTIMKDYAFHGYTWEDLDQMFD